MTDNLAALKQEMTAVEDYLTAAQKILDDGYMPDIAGFEKRVALLCSALAKSAEATRAEYLPRLKQLQNTLNKFEENMRKFHEARIKAGKHG